MVWEQTALFALRGVTTVSQLSCAMDKPAPSGTLLLLHVCPARYFYMRFDRTSSHCLLPLHSKCIHGTHLCSTYPKVLGHFCVHAWVYCPLFLCGWISWRVDPWSPCSASCGGGSQTRSVRCVKGPDGRSREVESQRCLGTGRRPSDNRLCSLLPCARWTTTNWGPVSLLTLTASSSQQVYMNSVKAIDLCKNLGQFIWGSFSTAE